MTKTTITNMTITTMMMTIMTVTANQMTTYYNDERDDNKQLTCRMCAALKVLIQNLQRLWSKRRSSLAFL